MMFKIETNQFENRNLLQNTPRKQGGLSGNNYIKRNAGESFYGNVKRKDANLLEIVSS